MTKNKEEKDDFEAVRIVVDALISFDDVDQERIIRWAREKLGLSVNIIPTSIQQDLPAKPNFLQEISSLSELNNKQTKDIKSFIENKDPKNDRQLAAVVAYYYAFEAPADQKKNSIGSQDIVEACRLAQKHRPKTPIQTLINAAYSGLLDKAEETGQYKLNAVGENLVAMALPGTSEGRRVTKRQISIKKNRSKKRG